MGFAIDLDVLGTCSLCQIAKDELSIGHGSTPPMMIIRVVKTAPGSVSMAVAPTPPPAPTIKKPDEGSSAKHRKRTRGDAVDDVCAKRRVKEPSWEWLYCWVTSVSDADERWRAWM